MKASLLALALTISLAGCASVSMSDPQMDAQAKKFEAPTTNAGLYVYRNETFGAAIKMDIDVDGTPMGRTASKTFLYKEITPGKHTVVSKAGNEDTLVVDAKPGTLIYIWQEVKMGLLIAGSKLHLVDEAEGQKGVAESKLAESK